MTGGQTTFQLSDASANSGDGGPGSQQIRRLATGAQPCSVIAATRGARPTRPNQPTRSPPAAVAGSRRELAGARSGLDKQRHAGQADPNVPIV